jgi:hypothetical protein
MMEDLKRDAPDIVTYRIPRIEVYQVTDDELRRLEEGCAHVGQDLTFAVASASFFVAFVIALLSGTFSDAVRDLLIALAAISAIVAIYTGVRWARTRGTTPRVIAEIRSRKAEPSVPQDSS